jgi:hypothetical protein
MSSSSSSTDAAAAPAPPGYDATQADAARAALVMYDERMASERAKANPVQVAQEHKELLASYRKPVRTIAQTRAGKKKVENHFHRKLVSNISSCRIDRAPR